MNMHSRTACQWLVTGVMLGLWLGLGVGCALDGGQRDRASADIETGETSRASRVGLVPKVQSPISDVPVPVGFNIVEPLSRHYTVGNQRIIDHTYEGRESKFDVDRFYRERMPLKDWRSEGNQMVRGTFEQRYRKGDEVAEISVGSERNAFGLERTRVSITIRPEGSNTDEADPSDRERE